MQTRSQHYTKEQIELCLLACHGIPESYLVRGPQGLWEWFARESKHGQDVDHHTWLTLSDLRRYLPLERGAHTIRTWAAEGRQGGSKRVFLYTERKSGRKCSTLFHYYAMQARCDPTSIQTILTKADGSSLHVAACAACDKTQEINCNYGDDPRHLLITHHEWSIRSTGWRCSGCRSKK